jgi:hypothetical protein
MSIEKLAPFLATTYENFPKGRFIGLVVLRTTLSETIFRTEGTGGVHPTFANGYKRPDVNLCQISAFESLSQIESYKTGMRSDWRTHVSRVCAGRNKS